MGHPVVALSYLWEEEELQVRQAPGGYVKLVWADKHS